MTYKHYFVIKGRKWFDKINCNTYNSVKIYDMKKEISYKLNFEYGYGAEYYYRALKHIEQILRVKSIDYKIIKIYDAGADYDTKKNVKNFNY